MAISQNGWPANDRSLVESRLIPGTGVNLTVRKDEAGDILLYVASQFDKRVEDIDNARGALDDWGYAERPIRGGTSLSNHASGTAEDLNATKHPLGAVGTFTPHQVQDIHTILAEVDHVVRWGGDYSGRKDEMHFEINASYAEVIKVAGKITLEEDDMIRDGDDIKDLQEDLNFLRTAGFSQPPYNSLKIDGVAGPLTIEALDKVRRVYGRTRHIGSRPTPSDISKVDRLIHEVKEHNFKI